MALVCTALFAHKSSIKFNNKTHALFVFNLGTSYIVSYFVQFYQWNFKNIVLHKLPDQTNITWLTYLPNLTNKTN